MGTSAQHIVLKARNRGIARNAYHLFDQRCIVHVHVEICYNRLICYRCACSVAGLAIVVPCAILSKCSEEQLAAMMVIFQHILLGFMSNFVEDI